ncbi:MAG: hypothetical protein K940chlam3_00011 [Chlamydiae bacterium]|nr:hypothetical protein [Chlamydiota bacterium]
MEIIKMIKKELLKSEIIAKAVSGEITQKRASTRSNNRMVNV